jgi:hypothetical protein
MSLLQSLPWVAPGRGLVWLFSADAAITTPSCISSVGIEHHPPGLDPAWARIWFLDAAAHPVRSCRLVPLSSVQQRAPLPQAPSWSAPRQGSGPGSPPLVSGADAPSGAVASP